jgi:AcrR family transcriptional regulator
MVGVGGARPGGRTARTAAAVFGAAIEELGVRPYGEISVESIAARAGVHRTTVYRRWGSAAEVISRALVRAAEQEVPVVDTGSLAGDLHALVTSVAEVISSPAGGAVLRTLVVAARTDEEVRGVSERFWQQRRNATETIVGRAVDRGELAAGTDAEALVRAAVAPLYFDVLVSGRPVGATTVQLAVDAALAAAAAGTFSTERIR